MGVFYPDALIESNGVDDFKALYNNAYLNQRFKKLWNGPYINKETTDHKILGSYYIDFYRDDMSACETKGDCIAFIALTETPLKTWWYINNYFDASLGETPENEDTANLTGVIRASLLTDPTTLLYKSVQRRKSF